MNNGISLYFGLEQSLAENLDYANKARKVGIKRYFTSLQIPGTDETRLKREFAEFVNWNKVHQGEIICDISPYTLEILQVNKDDLVKLKSLGINTLRLDDGFNPEEMVKLSSMGFKLVLNASTCDDLLLGKLQELKMDFTKVEAMHNFYPKRFTGLNREYFQGINRLLKEYGIKIAAFAPDYTNPRMPIYAGLPTMEEHRYLPFILAYQDLLVLGVNNVFIGDCLVKKEVLEILGQEPTNLLQLPLNLPLEYKFLAQDIFGRDYTRRPEVTDYTYRLIESRSVFNKYDLPSNGDTYAHAGDILINNDLADRYKGEVEIAKRDFHCGKTYNIIGHVHPFSLNLLIQQYFGNKISFLDLTIKI